MVQSPSRARGNYAVVSLKLKNQVKQQLYLSNMLFNISKILMVDACDITRFYVKLTFCINSICKELF